MAAEARSSLGNCGYLCTFVTPREQVFAGLSKSPYNMWIGAERETSESLEWFWTTGPEGVVSFFNTTCRNGKASSSFEFNACKTDANLDVFPHICESDGTALLFQMEEGFMPGSESGGWCLEFESGICALDVDCEQDFQCQSGLCFNSLCSLPGLATEGSECDKNTGCASGFCAVDKCLTPVCDDTTGHCYVLIEEDSDYTFEQAQSYSSDLVYDGNCGFLATLTSAAEILFVTDMDISVPFVVGAKRSTANTNTFEWFDHPETGTPFVREVNCGTVAAFESINGLPNSFPASAACSGNSSVQVQPSGQWKTLDGSFGVFLVEFAADSAMCEPPTPTVDCALDGSCETFAVCASDADCASGACVESTCAYSLDEEDYQYAFFEVDGRSYDEIAQVVSELRHPTTGICGEFARFGDGVRDYFVMSQWTKRLGIAKMYIGGVDLVDDDSMNWYYDDGGNSEFFLQCSLEIGAKGSELVYVNRNVYMHPSCDGRHLIFQNDHLTLSGGAAGNDVTHFMVKYQRCDDGKTCTQNEQCASGSCDEGRCHEFVAVTCPETDHCYAVAYMGTLFDDAASSASYSSFAGMCGSLAVLETTEEVQAIEQWLSGSSDRVRVGARRGSGEPEDLSWKWHTSTGVTHEFLVQQCPNDVSDDSVNADDDVTTPTAVAPYAAVFSAGYPHCFGGSVLSYDAAVNQWQDVVEDNGDELWIMEFTPDNLCSRAEQASSDECTSETDCGTDQGCFFGKCYDVVCATGHCYSRIEPSRIPWDIAVSYASNLTYDGNCGYLATLNNEAEYDFVAALVDVNNVYVGGHRGFDDLPRYNWYWMTEPAGPELFAEKDIPDCNSGSQYSTLMDYSPWRGGEPNSCWEPEVEWNGNDYFNDCSETDAEYLLVEFSSDAVCSPLVDVCSTHDQCGAEQICWNGFCASLPFCADGECYDILPTNGRTFEEVEEYVSTQRYGTGQQCGQLYSEDEFYVEKFDPTDFIALRDAYQSLLSAMLTKLNATAFLGTHRASDALDDMKWTSPTGETLINMRCPNGLSWDQNTGDDVFGSVSGYESYETGSVIFSSPPRCTGERYIAWSGVFDMRTVHGNDPSVTHYIVRSGREMCRPGSACTSDEQCNLWDYCPENTECEGGCVEGFCRQNVECNDEAGLCYTFGHQDDTFQVHGANEDTDWNPFSHLQQCYRPATLQTEQELDTALSAAIWSAVDRDTGDFNDDEELLVGGYRDGLNWYWDTVNGEEVFASMTCPTGEASVNNTGSDAVPTAFLAVSGLLDLVTDAASLSCGVEESIVLRLSDQTLHAREIDMSSSVSMLFSFGDKYSCDVEAECTAGSQCKSKVCRDGDCSDDLQRIVCDDSTGRCYGLLPLGAPTDVADIVDGYGAERTFYDEMCGEMLMIDSLAELEFVQASFADVLATAAVAIGAYVADDGDVQYSRQGYGDSGGFFPLQVSVVNDETSRLFARISCGPDSIETLDTAVPTLLDSDAIALVCAEFGELFGVVLQGNAVTVSRSDAEYILFEFGPCNAGYACLDHSQCESGTCFRSSTNDPVCDEVIHTITSVTPASGGPSTVVTIRGTLGVSDSDITGVTLNGMPVILGVRTSTSVIVTVLPTAESRYLGLGAVSVFAERMGETIRADMFTVLANQITAVQPSQGKYSGGFAVTITGVFSTTVTSVTLNGVTATIVSQTGTAVTVTAGVGTAHGGLGDVVIQLASSVTLTKTNAFSYLIPGVPSASATLIPLAGQITLTISASTAFGSGSDITSVTLKDVAATILSQTDKTVTVTAGAGSGGQGDLVVSSASYGDAIATNVIAYYDEAVPLQGGSLWPDYASTAGGFAVTISGRSVMLDSAVSCVIDGTTVAATANKTAGTVVCTAPAHALGNTTLSIVGDGGVDAVFTLQYFALPTAAPISFGGAVVKQGKPTTMSGLSVAGASLGATLRARFFAARGSFSVPGEIISEFRVSAVGVDMSIEVSNAGYALVMVGSSSAINAVINTVQYNADSSSAGTAQIKFSVQDTSQPGFAVVETSLSVTVTAINQAPYLTKTSATAQAGVPSTVSSFVSPGALNEASQTVTMNWNVSDATMFSSLPIVSGGALRFTAARGGNATLSVVLSDNGGTADGGSDTSAALTFTIVVSSTTDVNSIVGGVIGGILGLGVIAFLIFVWWASKLSAATTASAAVTTAAVAAETESGKLTMLVTVEGIEMAELSSFAEAETTIAQIQAAAAEDIAPQSVCVLLLMHL
eukprot:TRINITY_DN6791_c0_g1_i1.p1 TRINITY_DN6791_c0_g1~~TRINITY_DN6791_c0_g1_i1.p1  ORF type:complete len:2236 (-),score=462.43 TRINITY_DN6791_c0_g1_i1:43-6750(-)